MGGRAGSGRAQSIFGAGATDNDSRRPVVFSVLAGVLYSIDTIRLTRFRDDDIVYFMLDRRIMDNQQARDAVEQGEFGAEIRESGDNVVIVLTQSWCTDWKVMERWLAKLQRKNQPDQFDVVVWEFIYDGVSFADEFRTFKERVLGNDQIPYLRYYRDGTLIDSSNFVGPRRFLARFEESDS